MVGSWELHLNLATGVWVGWEDRATHFFSTGEGQGAKMALPIWEFS